jgi:hypothetical protein
MCKGRSEVVTVHQYAIAIRRCHIVVTDTQVQHHMPLLALPAVQAAWYTARFGAAADNEWLLAAECNDGARHGPGSYTAGNTRPVDATYTGASNLADLCSQAVHTMTRTLQHSGATLR